MNVGCNCLSSLQHCVEKIGVQEYGCAGKSDPAVGEPLDSVDRGTKRAMGTKVLACNVLSTTALS